MLTGLWSWDNITFYPLDINEKNLSGIIFFSSYFSTSSHELDDRHSITSTTTINPTEITSAPAVDLELNINVQIASSSLYTS
jgi:hypothetical protein